MHEIVIAPSANRSLKRLPQELKSKILKEVKYIGQDPYLPQRLSGILHLCYSYHFNFKGTYYRIAYLIDEKEKRVIVVLVGSREGFYKKLQRIFR